VDRHVLLNKRFVQKIGFEATARLAILGWWPQ